MRPSDFDLAHQHICSDGMGTAFHIAKHARQLADAAWQADLADRLRRLANDFDECAQYTETVAPERRNAELLEG